MDKHPFDFDNASVRQIWTFALPSILVVAFCATLIPIPSPLKPIFQSICHPFRPSLTMHEAEAMIVPRTAPKSTAVIVLPSLWKSRAFTSLALLEFSAWLGLGAFQLATERYNVLRFATPILIAITWLYAALRPVLWPSSTAMFDLFSLYLVHFATGVLNVGGLVFEYRLNGQPLPPRVTLTVYGFNLVVLLILLTIVVSMPLGLPSSNIDTKEIGNTISPEDYCTLWQWISFHWVVPLMEKGAKITLKEDDVWRLSPTNRTRPLFLLFNRNKSMGLLRKIWAANSMDLIIDFVFTMASVVFNYGRPFFMQKILAAIDDPSPENTSRAYVYAFLAFLSSLLKAEAEMIHLWFGRRASIRVKSQLMAAIYDKALKRKDFSGIIQKNADPGDGKNAQGKNRNEAKENTADAGKIVSMMASDTGQIGVLVSGAYFLYSAPFEVIVATVFLYNLMGWPAFSGALVLLVCWPLNVLVSRRSVRLRRGYSNARDKRMGVLNELIGAIKTIKFFAWDDRWIARALESRKHEIEWIVKLRGNTLMFASIWTFGPIFISVLSFLVFVQQGNQLTISTAFTALSLFTMVRSSLLIIPTWIVKVLQCRVAVDRITAYLEEDEVDDRVSSLKMDLSSASEADLTKGLGIAKGSFKWNEVEQDGERDADNIEISRSVDTLDSNTTVGPETQTGTQRFKLRDISVMFPEGQLSVITGPTASGKTAFLMALLGEMTLLGGELVMNKNPFKVDEHGNMHTISYAAQSPWLQHHSIKDNILFGYPMEEDRYDQVLTCCALKPDLDILEDGDDTEIGARGVTLSGGQKARVALARAVYARTKYILLDDPLSAVDSHTARLLFNKLICGPLLQNRTVVLVTHHVELVLPKTNHLVCLVDGRIDVQGSPEDLRAQGVLAAATHQYYEEEKKQAGPTVLDHDVAAAGGDNGSGPLPSKAARKLVQNEHQEAGGVKWSIYKTYISASSYWWWGIGLFLVALRQLLGVGEKVWIKYWGDAGHDSYQLSFYESTAGIQHPLKLVPMITPTTSSLPDAQQNPMFYVGIYSAICICGGLISVLNMWTRYTSALRASRELFSKLLDTVVHATMRWFDTTPTGRILNRFQKDIETIDYSLVSTVLAVNNNFAILFSSVIVIIAMFPLFLVPAAVLGYFYQRIAVKYLNTARDLRRMNSNARSPIFSGFGELLEGIVTVRAFSAEQRFADKLHTSIDLEARMFYNFWMLNRHLLLHFEALGAIGLLATTLFSLSGFVGAGIAGICITSAISFNTTVYMACREWASLQLDLNSVERVVEYLELPQEPPSVVESNRVPAYWPSSSGNDNLLVLEDLTIQYAPELPHVLHDVSFSLKAKERVGLLGRTGSGKSTLAQSILRFVDPTNGRIIIDGVDIATIGLSDLRSRITFIPQEATLFSGTLRDNLDPFGEHEDADCLDVLYRVHLIQETQELTPSDSAQDIEREDTESMVTSVTIDTESKRKIGLDTQISAGGSNFSAGQRQLIVMARALLRRSSIIILDEATSSIDFATDTKIQTTIREEFTDSLLLTVAHRLHTVIDYDRLVVLDKGRVAEFDTPYNLIRKEGGIFRDMAMSSGTFAELESSAKASADANIGQNTKF